MQPKIPIASDYTKDIPKGYDIEGIRSQFPAIKERTISLNNGAGSLVYGPAIESVVKTMSTTMIQLEGGDTGSDQEIQDRKDRYKVLAAYMNADADEIAFATSTTQLLRNLTQSIRPNMYPDSEIVVSTLCHEAGITNWIALAKSLNITIKWWSPPLPIKTKNPKLSIETLRPLLSPKTRLVTCGHINNVLGSIHDIRAIADLVHTVPGALVSVDGVAWAPHRPIDVKALDVDFYVFSWYKVFGPHLAQLYARRSVHQRLLTSLNHYHLDSQSLDTKLAIGTNCHELENCLLPIMDYVGRVGWDKIAEYEVVIARPLLDYLKANSDRYTLYGEQSSDPELRVSCISFEVNGISSEIIAHEIHESSDVRIVWGDNYSVMAVHDLLRVGEGGLLRVTLVHYNTVEEVITFIKVLDRVVAAEVEKRKAINGVKHVNGVNGVNGVHSVNGVNGMNGVKA
ncbi:MAG: hypothetical protein M1821_000391 [Bathelium mastoideum]|nr:MAG: hypothetical protein M1821_000391 [Bathelium mastoideum]